MSSNVLNGAMFLAPLINVSKTAYSVIEIVLFVCMVLCAIFTILVVLFQPGNSEGVGVISGKSDSFLEKNKNSSLEGKLKKWTIVSLCVIIVFSILFFLVASEILIGVGPVIQG